ncbi:putative beta N-acetylglucosaminidase [Streptomyces ambofaciens ATCC 23877]|uniref:beta-N-acetylhexosaminidase n=1 Tax=Streptomyces ambofaciens (strain ATCC 23877 / 3486 / DSM 40053 / JCM 4204 / NBRC 12836 / NRRL B-2516) TaxID=278992 RepID=A0ACM6_STRA7|nr:family 20 glycosylhydrolase [Streptomyces ambofaciens]AKZ60112.1 putative beta N-acetylglucosaminidase [Streptomyces ambofaciens ATCC 23877]CAJ88231.1 putative beta N-acetylglucosaminidase [Streptomyces ambofaciens ATCC 23877]
MDVVIPGPANRTAAATGEALGLAGPWRVATTDHRLTAVAGTVRALLAPHLGDRLLPPDTTGTTATTLELVLDAASSAPHRAPVGISPRGTAEPGDESYRITVDEHGVRCRSTTPEGVFRAATTALQTLAAATGPVPRGELTDAPHYAWRGLMVDPARGFLTPAELRRVVDLAALYKLNVLHLHLTDNEGWRLPLPAAAATGGPDAAARQYYIPDDYRALQAYAAERFVTVVPEIDLPGHCAALREAVPGLPAAPAPEGLKGRFPYVPPLDLADPDTRSLVASVLTEVCELTDGPFVHVGGDEAVGMTADSFALAVRELRALVRAAGKHPLAWQEASRAGMTANDIAQFWVDVPMMDLPDTQEELDRRPELLAAGYTPELVRALKRFFAPTDDDLARILDGGGRVLLSPQSHLYLDRRYAPDIVPPGQAEDAARLGFATYRPRGVRHTAAWDPAAYGIPEERIAGIAATVFGESIQGLDDLTTLLLPRLPSVAHTAWTGRAPDWDAHRDRVARHGRLWEDRGLSYLASTEIPWA